MNYLQQLQKYIEEEIKIIQSIDLNSVNTVMNVLEKARLDKKTVYICGNGGSAATASHFTGDFNKGVSEGLDVKYRFVCLSDNVPSMMAIANDISYDEIFREQLKGRMESGDILIGISGSGNSANVVNAMEYAGSIGGTTIAIVGYDGGRMKSIADYCIHINANDMQISEDLHMVLDHLMMHTLCECK